MPHRGIVRLVRRASFAELDSERVFLLLAPAAFDASTLEIWGPLLNGGRLAVPLAGNLAPGALAEELARAGVNTLWLTAGLFHLVVDERPAALRRVTPAPGRRRRAVAAPRPPRPRRAAGRHADQRLRTDREHHLHLLPPAA